jgi:hypothetical protein
MHGSPPTAVEDASSASVTQMVEWIARRGPKSGADALRELRMAFPDTTLELRVAALNTLIRQQGGDTSYLPR